MTIFNFPLLITLTNKVIFELSLLITIPPPFETGIYEIVFINAFKSEHSNSSIELFFQDLVCLKSVEYIFTNSFYVFKLIF